MSTATPKFKDVEVTALLKNKMEQDADFKSRFEWISGFYWMKFEQGKAPGYSKEDIFEKYSHLSQQLIHSGYFLMLNFLGDIAENHEAKQEIDPLLQLSPHQLRNELPVFVEDVFGEAWDKSPGSDFHYMWMVKNLTFASPDILLQCRKDLIMEGMYQAIYSHPLYTGQSYPLEESSFLLGHPADLHFISPQIYIAANGLGADMERWTIHFWSNSKMSNRELGSILLLREPKEKEQDQWLLYVLLENIITGNEKEILINGIVDLLPQTIRENLIIPFYSTLEAKVYIPNLETTTEEGEAETE